MRNSRGYSLPELLIATVITAGIVAVAFQLFHQNARAFRDQALILEMQQTARMVLSQVSDDIRIAGQGIPSDGPETLLPGTGVSRLNLRATFSGTETPVNTPLPFSAGLASSMPVLVEGTSGFSAGRQVFLWDATGWVRARIDSVSASSKTIWITPSTTSRSPMQFTTPPVMSPDEAVAIYWDSGSNVVRRTTATNTQDSAVPNWSPANELATNVTEFAFDYLDKKGNPMVSDIFTRQSEVAAIQTRATVRASAPLSNGTRPTYSQLIRNVPRNLRIRNQTQ